AIRRFFRTNIDGFSSPGHACCEAGRRLDRSRCADGDEHRTSIQRLENFVHLVWHLAEPADMRAYDTAACATWQFGGRFVGSRIGERPTTASITPALEQFAMHVGDPLRPGLLVKVVDILCTEE